LTQLEVLLNSLEDGMRGPPPLGIWAPSGRGEQVAQPAPKENRRKRMDKGLVPVFANIVRLYNVHKLSPESCIPARLATRLALPAGCAIPKLSLLYVHGGKNEC